MDKQKAIELLKQKSKEAVYLASLRFPNNEYLPWRRNIEDILETTWGVTSTEYKRVADVHIKTKGTREAIQRAYKVIVHRIQQEVNSIIQKYEILGIEAEPIPIAKENSEQGVMMNKIQPAAFIVHGGRSGVLDKLREFVEALGIKPLVVEMLPSKGMPLVDKVKKYQQEADRAIILATRGGIIDIKSGKQHPRLNVIDELSSFWEAFPEKVILLLEKGVELPSNKAGLTYEPFARQSMDRAFIAIARELTEMKILKAVKPKE